MATIIVLNLPMINFLLKIKKRVIDSTSKKQRDQIKKFAVPIMAWFFRNNLIKLAIIFGTDKYGSHWYMPHYQKHFNRYKNKKLKILEIGIGGGKDPLYGAKSLRVWKTFFRRSTIYGIDIYNKKALEEKRIKLFQGDQTDKAFLQDLIKTMGRVDIIIDDGSHINSHIITTFEILFPLLKTGGLYVVEDMQTSYWPNYGGDSENLHNPDTAVNYFRNLIDGLNHKEFIKPGYVPTYCDRNIIAMHFYHNLLFIYKGDNNEGSNILKD